MPMIVYFGLCVFFPHLFTSSALLNILFAAANKLAMENKLTHLSNSARHIALFMSDAFFLYTSQTVWRNIFIFQARPQQNELFRLIIEASHEFSPVMVQFPRTSEGAALTDCRGRSLLCVHRVQLNRFQPSLTDPLYSLGSSSDARFGLGDVPQLSFCCIGRLGVCGRKAMKSVN